MGRRPTREGHTLARAAGLVVALIAGVANQAGAIGPGAARATEIAARTGRLADGPQLVGGRTAYLVYGRRDYRILAAAPGGPPNLLYRAALAPGFGAFGAGDLRHLSEDVSFGAADGWIAVQTAIRGPALSSRGSSSPSSRARLRRDSSASASCSSAAPATACTC